MCIKIFVFFVCNFVFLRVDFYFIRFHAEKGTMTDVTSSNVVSFVAILT